MSHLTVITPPSLHVPSGKSILLLGNPAWREEFISSLLTTEVTDLFHIPEPLDWKNDWTWAYMASKVVDKILVDGNTIQTWELVMLSSLNPKIITIISDDEMWEKVGKSFKVVSNYTLEGT